VTCRYFPARENARDFTDFADIQDLLAMHGLDDAAHCQ